MKRKSNIITFLILAEMLVSLSGCGTSPEASQQETSVQPAAETQVQTEVENNVTSADNAPVSDVPSETVVSAETDSVSDNESKSPSVKRNHDGSIYIINTSELKLSEDFSNGYIFLRGNQGNQGGYGQYVACMDKNGEIQYVYKCGNCDIFHSQDGLMQIFNTPGLNETTSWVSLDTSGTPIFRYIVNPVPTSENPIVTRIVAGGDRYIAVEEKKTDFSGVTVVLYAIVDYQGNVTYSCQKEKDGLYVLDCGSHIFRFGTEYVNAQTGSVIYSSNSSTNLDFRGGYATTEGKVITKDGTIIDFPEFYAAFPNYVRKTGYDIYNHYFVFSNYASYPYYCYLYRWDTNQVFDCFPGINEDNLPQFYTWNGYIACTAKGSDNNWYYTIADCEGNIIKPLTMLPNTYNMAPDFTLITNFINNTISIRYYIDHISYLYIYDIQSKEENFYNLKETSPLTWKIGNEYDGWTRISVSAEGNISGDINFTNQNGDFLLEYLGQVIDTPQCQAIVKEQKHNKWELVFFADDSKIIS